MTRGLSGTRSGPGRARRNEELVIVEEGTADGVRMPGAKILKACRGLTPQPLGSTAALVNVRPIRLQCSHSQASLTPV